MDFIKQLLESTLPSAKFFDKIPGGFEEEETEYDSLSGISALSVSSDSFEISTGFADDEEMFDPVKNLCMLTASCSEASEGDFRCEPENMPMNCNPEMISWLQSCVAEPLKVPDISGGLGRHLEKRNIVDLENYISKQMTFMVYQGELSVFIAPCWKRLDLCKAMTEFRRLLGKDGLTKALTTKEYRDIYQLLLSNPEIQRQNELQPPLHYLNLCDGTLDLSSMEFGPHNPDDGFFSFLNLPYGAIMHATNGDVFEKFVDHIGNGNSKIRQQLLELVALAITGCQAKVFYVLLGPPIREKRNLVDF